MDFNRVSQDALIQYLEVNGEVPAGDLVQQATALYNEQRPNHQWTATILDLYVATEFLRLNPDVHFTWAYFNSLSPQARVATGQLWGLQPTDPAFNIRFNHISNLLSGMSAERDRIAAEQQLGLQMQQAVPVQRLPGLPEQWYTQFETQRCYRELRCLTFNICDKCQSKSVCKTTCLPNIAAYIESGPTYDIIGLQSANSWRQLSSRRLASMTVVEYQPGKEGIATFYNPRYRVDSGVSVIKSWLQDENAPMLMVFFPGVCVINVQIAPGYRTFRKHYYLDELSEHVADALIGNNSGSRFTVDGKEVSRLDTANLNAVVQKLKTYHLILLGDLETPVEGRSTLPLFQSGPYTQWKEGAERPLVGFHNTPTCCDSGVKTTQANAKQGSYDQILVTQPGLVAEHEIPLALTQASNHLPVRATVLVPY